MNRRVTQLVLAVLLLAWVGGAYYGYRQVGTTDKSVQTVTIGYQKGDPVDLSRARGVLVDKMKAKGYKIVYKEFSDGSAEMQALAAGSIDYARTGDTPPVTAAASGTDIAYIAAGAKRSKGSAILVQKDSSIKTLADLKGKKIAYTQSTSSQYLLLMALQKAGLSKDDVTWVNMKQSDAAIAFAKNKVDAWVTWDPYTAQGEITQQAKILVNGVGLSNNRDFILSTQSFAKKNSELNSYLVKYLAADMKWANQNTSTATKILAKTLGMKKTIIKKMMTRRDWTLTPVTNTIASEEQSIADTFYSNGLISKKIVTSDDVIKVDQ